VAQTAVRSRAYARISSFLTGVAMNIIVVLIILLLTGRT
jgi:hypothetical protein